MQSRGVQKEQEKAALTLQQLHKNKVAVLKTDQLPASSFVDAESTVSLFYGEAESPIAASTPSRIICFWF